MNHFIEKCKSCQTVISQCRCADHNKEVQWSLCEKCKIPKKVITEDMKVHLDWYKEASEQTLETLPAFMKKLAEEFEHDYGTICHALAASATAAAWAMNRTEQGGITGFQGGAVMWEFIRQWMYVGEHKPLRLVDYSNMLYPQYADKFERTISQDTWKWLQERAKEQLTNDAMSPRVREHMERIVNGVVPFGYTVEKGDNV